MTMMIGFGATEQSFEESEEDAFRAFVQEQFDEIRPCYFTEDFTKSVSEWMDARAKATRVAADEYKTAADHPNRYSYFYSYVLGDASFLVAIVKFSHINRRHAFSPDGWALMQTERLFKVEHSELGRSNRTAA